MFNECWRQMRDFFYDPELHGVDWLAMRKKYEPLVDHVAHRADLTYIIGEMISELNAGHLYVGGGELPEVRKVQQGLLGAEFRRDPKSGFFQITRILPGENWNPKRRSPLTEVGVNVAGRDWIVAVNGRPTSDVKNINELLVDRGGQAGRALGERQTRGRRGTPRGGHSHCRRGRSVLLRLGAGQHQEGVGCERRQRSATFTSRICRRPG